MSKKKLDFSPNDFVVYPAHGVGKVVSVETQEVAGFELPALGAGPGVGALLLLQHREARRLTVWCVRTSGYSQH